MSKTGATEVTTEYKVYNNKTVVCKLNFKLNPPLNEKYISLFPYRFVEDKKITKQEDILWTGITVTGVAICHDNDEFDETLGKRIAESRAKIKMFDMLNKINGELWKMVRDSCSDPLCEAANESFYCKLKENLHLKSLINK